MNLPTDFTLFGGSHITVLIILVAGCIATIKLPNNSHYKEFIRTALAFLLALQIIVFNSYHLLRGSFDVTRFLPFHLCSVSAYLVVLALLTKNEKVQQITYFFAPVAATMAMVFPALGTGENFPSFRFVEFFWSHLLIVIGTVFILHIDKPKITWRSMWVAYGCLILYTITIYGLNILLDANYLYLIKPQFPMTYFGPAPWHIAGMSALVLTIFAGQTLAYKKAANKRKRL